MKKGFIKIIIALLLCLVCIFLFIKIFAKKDNEEVGVQDIPEIEISENVTPDEEKPDDVIYIKLSTENKILSGLVLGEFDNGQNLTTEQYLKTAFYVLNNNLVESNKKTYSEKEINDIVYSIFNKELSENRSIEGLTFENGKYNLEKKSPDNKVLKIVERGTAAGSTFIIFEINEESYIAKVGTNTITGENYIQSINKEN